ncbi:MAG TPA: glycine reductase, partial [Gammaproteobacteria bacterium]|nr:glycine reductase [Gammaproteobacteria bacterium]
MSLVARALEENGIATVVIGSAKDIVTFCGVPRFLFTDFPLGNPCGRPYDQGSKSLIMSSALSLLETATEPGTIIQTPLIWDETSLWKSNYMRVGDDN